MRIIADIKGATRAARTRANTISVAPRAILVGAGLALAGCGFVIGLNSPNMQLAKPRPVSVLAPAAPRIAGTLRAGESPDLPQVTPIRRPQASRPDMAAPRPDAPVAGNATRPFYPPRLHAGAPPVVPPARPDRFTFDGPRPRLRPETLVPKTLLARFDAPAASDGAHAAPSPVEAPGAEVEDGQERRAGLGTSLRPRLRPESLNTAVTVSAPEPAEGVVTAATAPWAGDGAPDTAPPPVLHDPTLQLAQGVGNCPRRLTRDMPRRSGNAPDGTAFMAQLASVGGTVRDRHVTGQILSGNMPDTMRRLTPVSVTGRLRDGTRATLTLCVMPDYLALGGNRDFVRVPLGLRAATRIAERFDMLLPTAQMVDLIYRAADLRLTPRPMTPGPQMTSTAYLVKHNATVEGQRRRAGAGATALISGHKKDLVLTNRITRNPSRVAIYGWHRPGGKPIQPLSTVHGAAYADYSHGIRLVSRTAYLDGRAVDLRQLMSDPAYSALVSREGPIRGPRLLMASLAGN